MKGNSIVDNKEQEHEHDENCRCSINKHLIIFVVILIVLDVLDLQYEFLKNGYFKIEIITLKVLK